MKLDSELKRIGLKVRAKTERFARKNRYQKTLEGCCGIASGWVLDELNKSKIKARAILVIDELEIDLSHCYVLVEEKYIFDVTATQFGEEKIVIQDRNELKAIPWYWGKNRKKIITKERLAEEQIKTGWCIEQVAH